MSYNIDERNAYPVYGQIEATESLATPVRDSVCSLTKILEAEKRTHRHVGYKNSVSRFHMLVMSKCNDLCNELISDTYRPVKGEKYEIFAPKYRVVTSSKYRDRIPQSSFIINYFYPVVIPWLIPYNCACIKGRGTDYAREKLKDILRKANPDDYCLKVDMKNYFASIRHDVLFDELSKRISDPWAMHYFMQTVNNTGGPVGLDLGSEVYQLSATSFMNRLDHVLDMGTYLRYQDDLVFIGCKRYCKIALSLVNCEADRLKIQISKKKTYIQPISRPIKFLGYSFMRHDTGRITMKRLPEKIRQERRRLRRMKSKGIPFERVAVHYEAVRASLKKGSRSDLVKMDRYFNNLFSKEVTDDRNKKRANSQRKETKRNGSCCLVR